MLGPRLNTCGWRALASSAAIALLLVGSGGHGFAAETKTDAPLPTMDMFDQLQLERRAVRILETPAVQQEIQNVEALYRRTWIAKTPDGHARLELAAARMALAAVENAILNDPARPQIMWVITQPREWYGVKWPGSAWGAHNPDNVSRDTMIDGASTYEITGQRTGSGPAQETFLLYGSFIGEKVKNTEGAEVIGSLQDKDIKFAPDGSFRITVGPGPGAPGENHIQTRPNAKVLKIRNALENWWTQVPDRLRIRRVAGPPAPPPRSDAQVAAEAAALLHVQAPYWLEFSQKRTYSAPPNTTRPLEGRAGGWGYLAGGWFKLNEDEALVVTLDAMGAGYLGFQVCDLWSIPPNYIDYNAGLNKSQARANADGTFTYVISAKDPGVWNWVDTVGMRQGTYALRWQRLANPNPDVGSAVRSTRLVKIADLKKMLPPETVWVDAEQRKAQLADRAASFARRMSN